MNKKLTDGNSIGIFSKTVDSAIVEGAGFAGLDFIILDMEHGIASQETIHNHVRAAYTSGIAPIIRTKDGSPHSIGSALDSGAHGIQVPNISSADEVKEVLNAAKFYPQGNRGVCRFVKAAQYGTQNKQDYFKTANSSLIIIQVEGEEGVSNLDEILAVKGIDVIFIGPYDLSQSLGVPGDITSPIVTSAIERVVHKGKEVATAIGCFTDTVENMHWLKSLGVKYIAYSVDINIFAEGCRSIVSNFNNKTSFY